jgi:hypothetical protein
MGGTGGIFTHREWAHVVKVDHGKIARWLGFSDMASALRVLACKRAV